MYDLQVFSPFHWDVSLLSLWYLLKHSFKFWRKPVFFPFVTYAFGVCVLRSVLWCHLSVLHSFHLRIHFNSIPECSSIRSPKLKGRTPNRLPFLQTAASGRAPVSPHFCLLRWASCSPLRVSSSPGWLNSLKAPALWLLFYLKGRSSGTAQWRTRPGQSEGSLCSPGTAPHQYWLGVCAEVGGLQFVYGVLWLSRIDEFIDHMVEASVLPSSPPERMFQPSNQKIGLYGDPIWKQSKGPERALISITKTPINQDIARFFFVNIVLNKRFFKFYAALQFLSFTHMISYLTITL